jgi:PEP-CTERM motif
VTDLTPDDDAAAAFYYHSSSTTMNSWLNLNGTNQYFTESTHFFPVPPSLGISAARDGASIELEILPGLFSAHGEAVGNSGTMDTMDETARVGIQNFIQLAVAPHTVLQISSTYTGSLIRTGLESGLLFAYSGAGLSTSFNGNPYDDYVGLSARGNEADEYLSRELMLVLRNEGDTVLNLTLGVTQTAYIEMAAPVPEPSSYVMLLGGGLMLLPGLRRRLRQPA